MPQERRSRTNVNDTVERNTADDVAQPVDEEKIQQRAYERYRERGSQDGRDVEDWLEDERELLRESER
jgi:hypothetical protein